MAKLNINNVTVLLRTDTTANWTSKNPVLKKGEIGIETDTSGDTWVKIGDGSTAWASLPYMKAVFDTTSLATVATSGKYSDLSDTPTIPAVTVSGNTISFGSVTIGVD